MFGAVASLFNEADVSLGIASQEVTIGQEGLRLRKLFELLPFARPLTTVTS